MNEETKALHKQYVENRLHNYAVTEHKVADLAIEFSNTRREDFSEYLQHEFERNLQDGFNGDYEMFVNTVDASTYDRRHYAKEFALSDEMARDFRRFLIAKAKEELGI